MTEGWWEIEFIKAHDPDAPIYLEHDRCQLYHRHNEFAVKVETLKRSCGLCGEKIPQEIKTQIALLGGFYMKEKYPHKKKAGNWIFKNVPPRFPIAIFLVKRRTRELYLTLWNRAFYSTGKYGWELKRVPQVIDLLNKSKLKIDWHKCQTKLSIEFKPKRYRKGQQP